MNSLGSRALCALLVFAFAFSVSADPPLGVARIIVGPPHGNNTIQIASAQGIYGGGRDAWGNIHLQGRYKKYYAADFLQGSDATITWTDLDGQIDSAVANGQQFVLLLSFNSGDPSKSAQPNHGLPAKWISDGAEPIALLNENHDTNLYQFLSWDTVFQTDAMALIASICDHVTMSGHPVDGTVAEIAMGGLGSTTEMHMPDTFPYPDPDNTANAAAAAAKYIPACNAFVAQYNAHLHKTVFTAVLALPFANANGCTGSGCLGNTTLQTLVDTWDAAYGYRIGYENWGLNAKSADTIPPGFLPNKVIYDHRYTNAVGFQMTGSQTSCNAGNLCGQGGAPCGGIPGCLQLAMQAGANLGAQYLQVFGDDANNSDLFPVLDLVRPTLYPRPFELP